MNLDLNPYPSDTRDSTLLNKFINCKKKKVDPVEMDFKKSNK